MKTSTTVLSILAFLLSPVLISAEETDDAVYNSFSVCSDTAIQVTDVQFACDSPGTFYYGSGKYRNSPNCTAGDKGKFVVDFYINDASTIASIGTPMLDVSAAGNYGWYEITQNVFESEDLCSLDSLKSLSGSTCPEAGKYRIRSNFYFDEVSNDAYYYNPVFVPTLSVGFKSSRYQNTYDYGGANTPYCSGTTFFTPIGNRLKVMYANSVVNFFRSFGILLFTIMAMGAFIWFMVNKPRSLKEARQKIGIPRRHKKLQVFDDNSSDDSYSNSESFDFNKLNSPTARQSFLDF